MVFVLFFLWIITMIIFYKSHMNFFKFVVGSVGLFCFLMYVGRYNLEHFLEYSVTWLLWLCGRLTTLFVAYPEYSMITVYKGFQAVSFFVNYECSGFVETLVYVCLLLFYPIYRLREKVKYLILGVAYIIFSNVIRVFFICIITKFLGNSMFFFSHTVFARLLFFALMVILYYYVFTRPHIIRQKVGNVRYGS